MSGAERMASAWVGGIIPDGDVDALRRAGIAATFGPGSSVDDIVATFEELHRAATGDGD